MLEVNAILEDKNKVLEQLSVRGIDASLLIEKVESLDEKRKKIQHEMDRNKEQVNKISKEIGELFREGKKEEAEKAKAKTITYKENAEKLNQELNKVVNELFQQLVQIPNIPHDTVPPGNTDEENEIIYQVDTLPAPEGKPHWELAREYDLIDFELGNKITGSGFPLYKGNGAKLQRALIRFFLDEATKAGYEEYIPPLMVNEATAFGTGQLPDKEGQMYHIGLDNLYLIPTAEVPVTNILRDTIVKEEDLPVKMTGYTPCFRREAGSYGKDVRGLNRLHQFDKVEIVQVVHPDHSYEVLENMVKYVEGLLKKLELPYRIAKLCGGDLGFTSALTYDMEVFSAAQNRWLEVSSISNFETYQSNRMKIRFKDKNKKNRLVHTLNGSALALPRIVAALLENNQSDEGIYLPAILHEYAGMERIG